MNDRGKTLTSFQLAKKIIQTLEKAGYEAYIVGGCVRDAFLGIPPQQCETCDIATNAPPSRVQELFPRSVPLGLRFGVVCVYEDTASVDVATFRSESGYVDHRHPSHVAFSSLEQDAQRRDFTVNALYWRPRADFPDRSEIIDLVGGLADLDKRILRAIGAPKERFKEDALRILRALRFASSLGFSIEPITWEALKSSVPLLRAISAERIREELVRGFTRRNPAHFLDLLDSSGVLRELLPEVADMKGVPQPPEFHPEGDVFTHTRLMLSKMPENPPATLAFAVLLHDVGKFLTLTFNGRISFPNHDKKGAEIADAICKRLKFSNDEREQIVSMVQRHMMFISLQHMRPSKLARFLASPTIEEELQLHRLDCEASHGNLENYHFAQCKLAELKQAHDGNPLPAPLLRGDDLIALGIPPGPIYKRILGEVLELQIEGAITTKEDALKEARRIYSQLESASS